MSEPRKSTKGDKPRKRKRDSMPDAQPKKARIEIQRAPKIENQPYHIVTTSFYLSLAPKYAFHAEKIFPQNISTENDEAASYMKSLNPKTGIEKHHLDPMLMQFYEPVNGIIIAYSNIRFESTTAKITAEAPYAYVWTTVDLLVWRPRKEMILKGMITLQSASHIGLLVDNTWNASIPLAKIPKEWKFVENEDAEEESEETGQWVDAKGDKLEGLLRFEVDTLKAGGHIFAMEGSLLNTEKIERATLPE
ncbi:hypothetical protein BZA77DRAFT_314440 [Pyronema omphalodes]|nr:hypothetical protein BZA77DRAFT_314440 [Pyronema omphalodes]